MGNYQHFNLKINPILRGHLHVFTTQIIYYWLDHLFRLAISIEVVNREVEVSKILI